MNLTPGLIIITAVTRFCYTSTQFDNTMVMCQNPVICSFDLELLAASHLVNRIVKWLLGCMIRFETGRVLFKLDHFWVWLPARMNLRCAAKNRVAGYFRQSRGDEKGMLLECTVVHLFISQASSGMATMFCGGHIASWNATQPCQMGSVFHFFLHKHFLGVIYRSFSFQYNRE